eukprot:jgi/Bigna1/82311/fgenesh1_pg.91_\
MSSNSSQGQNELGVRVNIEFLKEGHNFQLLTAVMYPVIFETGSQKRNPTKMLLRSIKEEPAIALSSSTAGGERSPDKVDGEQFPDLFGRLLKKSKKLRTYQMRFVRVLEGAVYYSKKLESLSDEGWLRKQEALSKQAVTQGEIMVRNTEKDVAIIPIEVGFRRPNHNTAAAVARAFVDPERPHKLCIETKIGENSEMFNLRVPDHDDLWINKSSVGKDGKRIPPSETSATWVQGILQYRRQFLARKRQNANRLNRAPHRRGTSSSKPTTKPVTDLQRIIGGSKSEGSIREHKKKHSRTRSRRSGSTRMDIIRIDASEETAKTRQLEQLASYVPRILLSQYLKADMQSLSVLHDHKSRSTEDKKVPTYLHERRQHLVPPLSFALPCSCLVLADVSGFTNLNEAFSTVEGGAEKVTYHLNQYFTILLNIIEKHGGDCIKFAGDALIVLFKEEPEYDQQTYISRVHKHIKPIKPHQYTCLRAIQCALELGAQPAYKITGGGGFHKVELTLHVAVGYGDLQALHVGGHDNEWEFLLTGAPFKQIAKAIDISKKGEVVVTKEVWTEVKKHCKGKSVSAYGSSEVKVSAVIHDVKTLPAATITIPLKIWPAIERYVPRMVRDGIGKGMTRWLAELRNVSVIFVNIKGLMLNRRHNTPLDKTHEVLGFMESVVACNQGYRRQFLVDDKGTVLIVVFGVPPFSWEDNGYRAVKTAMELSQTLHTLDVDHAIGIASGMVYVGSVGSLSRREHAVVGDTVNSAARLSCKAPNGTVWIDEATSQQANRKIILKPCGSIKVKGKNKKIQIYEPTQFRVARNLLEGPHVIGREDLLKSCMNHLVAVKVNRAKRMLWLTGPAGVGKTVIMGYIYRLAKQNLQTFYTIGEATATSLAHNVWGQLLEQVMGLSGQPPSMMRHHIQEAVAQSDELKTLSPYLELLNTLLDCEFPATDESARLLNEAHMTDAMEAISLFTHNMLLELVKIAVGNRPSVWVIDDAQYIDYRSMQLLFDVFDSLPSVLMLMATRDIKAASTSATDNKSESINREGKNKSKSYEEKIKKMDGQVETRVGSTTLKSSRNTTTAAVTESASTADVVYRGTYDSETAAFHSPLPTILDTPPVSALASRHSSELSAVGVTGETDNRITMAIRNPIISHMDDDDELVVAKRDQNNGDGDGCENDAKDDEKSNNNDINTQTDVENSSDNTHNGEAFKNDDDGEKKKSNGQPEVECKKGKGGLEQHQVDHRMRKPIKEDNDGHKSAPPARDNNNNNDDDDDDEAHPNRKKKQPPCLKKESLLTKSMPCLDELLVGKNTAAAAAAAVAAAAHELKNVRSYIL